MGGQRGLEIFLHAKNLLVDRDGIQEPPGFKGFIFTDYKHLNVCFTVWPHLGNNLCVINV